DGFTNTVITTVLVGLLPIGVGVNTSTNLIYVTNANSNNVSVINGNTNAVFATVPVGIFPISVGVNTTTNLIILPLLLFRLVLSQVGLESIHPLI
ncbi:YncE family protein, partial [Bacillus thuringiensis]|uniref:YncE family protein n=1 Tax=Bacillus thuringiensis TaxID=1428 RepID=UPI0037C0B02F